MTDENFVSKKCATKYRAKCSQIIKESQDHITSQNCHRQIYWSNSIGMCSNDKDLLTMMTTTMMNFIASTLSVNLRYWRMKRVQRSKTTVYRWRRTCRCSSTNFASTPKCKSSRWFVVILYWSASTSNALQLENDTVNYLSAPHPIPAITLHIPIIVLFQSPSPPDKPKLCSCSFSTNRNSCTVRCVVVQKSHIRLQ